MAAYQPIQGGGLGWDVPDIAGTLLRARQLQQQEEAQRWAALRDQGAAARDTAEQQQRIAHQQFADSQAQAANQDAAMKEYYRLRNAGLGRQANEWASRHGISPPETLPQAGPAPVMPQMPQEPTAPRQDPMQGPIVPQQVAQPVDQYEATRGGGLGGLDVEAASARVGSVGQPLYSPQTMANMQQMQAERDAVAAHPAQVEEYGRQMTEVFPQQQAQYEQEQRAYDERAANPLERLTGPGGASFTYDPLEARRAEQELNQRRAQVFRQAVMGVPALAPYADQFTAFAAAGEDVKPSDVLRLQTADAAARAATAKETAKEEADKMYRPTVAMQDKWHRMAAAAAAARERAAHETPADVGNVYGPTGKRVAVLPSTGDKALDRKRSEEVTKANAVYTDLSATLRALDESLATEGVHAPSIRGFSLSDVAAKRESLHSHALIQLKTMADLGVLAGPDMAIMEQQMGSSLSNSAGVGGSKVPGIRKIIDESHARYLGGMGLNPGEVLPRLHGEGAPEPAKSLNVGGKVVHYDAAGNRLP